MEIDFSSEPLPAERLALPYQQHWRFAAALAALARPARRAVIRDGPRRIGAALIIERRLFGALGVALISRGPIWQVCDTAAQRAGLEALGRAVQGRWPAGLIVTPEAAADPFPARAAAVMTPATSLAWDIGDAPDTLRCAMSQSWRNALRRAEAGSLRFECGPPSTAALVALLELDKAQQKAMGYRALPAAFTAAWAGTGKGSLLLARAFEGADCVARALFLLHPPVATYHIAQTSPVGRKHAAQNLVLWRAALTLKALGFCRIDLGTVDTERARGLARFKLGTGARAHQHGATWLRGPGTAALAGLRLSRSGASRGLH